MPASEKEPFPAPLVEADSAASAGWRPVLLTLGAVWLLALLFAVAESGMGLPYPSLGLLAVLSVPLAILLRHELTSAERPPRLATGGEPTQSAKPADHASTRDPLTSLPTFQPFSERLLHEFQRAKNQGRSLSLLLIDINDLAGINARLGAATGDEALRRVSHCLASAKRANDELARLGDDEFGLLLKDCSRDGAVAFVERIYEQLARESIRAGAPDRPLTVWVGVCAGVGVLQPTMRSADGLLTAAIDDLNAAKAERNRRRERWLAAS